MPFVTEMDSLCTQLRGGELSRREFVDACARLSCQAVGCSRAGVWAFSSKSPEALLRCLGMYDRAADAMVRVPDRDSGDSAAYFEALRGIGKVIVTDAEHDPLTRDFYAAGLEPYGVVSLMAIAFSLNGALFGAFTCSQVGEPMRWNQRQVEIATKLGQRATLALAAVSPHQLDTLFDNL